jgi:DNA-binding SARP family transcriptional activator
MDDGGRLATGIAAPTADTEAPAALLDVAVLGPLEVRRAGALVRMGGPKQQLMLGLLVAGGGRGVSVEVLIDGVWGEDPPGSARGVVQTYVSGLRGGLGDVIRREGDGYRLDVGRSRVDAWRFEDAVEGCRPLRRRCPRPP